MVPKSITTDFFTKPNLLHLSSSNLEMQAEVMIYMMKNCIYSDTGCPITWKVTRKISSEMITDDRILFIISQWNMFHTYNRHNAKMLIRHMKRRGADLYMVIFYRIGSYKPLRFLPNFILSRHEAVDILRSMVNVRTGQY